MNVRNSERTAEIEKALARTWALTLLEGKKPVRPGWNTEAPLDRATLMRHDGNIGFRTGKVSGVIVLDVDPGGAVPDGWPVDTVAVDTGRGRHYYYSQPEGYGIGNSAGKIAPHVDVRGDGGQVVYPGSIHPETGTAYRWVAGRSPEEIELAPWPVELYGRLTRKERDTRPTPPSFVPLPPGSVPDAYLEKALSEELATVVAAPEGTRNHALNKAAHKLAGYVWPDEEHPKVRLLTAAMGTGLPEAEAAKTIESGWKSGAAKPRIAAPPTVYPGHLGHDVWHPETDGDPSEGTKPATHAGACEPWIEVLADDWFDTEPPLRDWTLGEEFPAGAVSFVVGSSGGGKSYLALEYQASVATGVTLIPERKPSKVGPVIYISLEDDRHEVRRRLRKICMAFNVGAAERTLLQENFHLVTHPLFESCVLRPNGQLAAGPHLEMLRQAIELYEARLVVVDTFARTLGARMDENANAAMGGLSALYASIVPEYCSLAIVAHPPKNTDNGTVRGAGAVDGAMRYREWLRPATDAETAGVECANPVWAVEVVKSNYGPKSIMFLERQFGLVGGVLLPSDATARAAKQRSAKEAETVRVLCEELAAHDVTVGELLGKHDADGRGKAARARMREKGVVLSCRDAGRVVEKARVNGVLILVERDGRTVLKPWNWVPSEDKQ